MTKTKTKAYPVEHFLITVDMFPAPYRLHCYTMTNDDGLLQSVHDKMFDMLEKNGVKRLPIILQTRLGATAESAAIVRKIVAEKVPEAAKLFETAADFHCSVFMLQADHPDDKRLMDLH